ncbi:MAG: hypothetical protein E6J02_10955 [Chloroflexi bacterium]|nr:MAG: hypothetical protein E6J02_10955 [Chloroflexota bacterium]TME16981.1 MAG: hypothetical protein E6I63_04510 [Chloroflexota bacterium]TME19407.1 MAG: hypothetical protein E6I70_04210 [Chloroflexota bacterium]
MSAKGSDSGYGSLLALGGFLAASLLVPLLGGVALDAATGRSPLFFLIGLALGIAAAVAVAYTRFKRYL